MRKHTQNVLLDSGLFIGMLGLLCTGTIIYFALPPGSHQQTFAGFTRHQWGDIHFWIATIFTVLIVAHLCLHFKWICSSFLKKRGH